MKKIISSFICFSLICSVLLCGCSDAKVQSTISEEGISKTETASVAVSDTTFADETVSSDTESTAEAEKNSDKQSSGREYHFLSILKEEDIDYVGIPYKDLTPEQVIQMWAQCTRERNWQKRYVIEKYLYSDMPEDLYKQDITFDSQGRLNGCYYDVEISDWYPEGNAENAKRLYFRIKSRIVFYDHQSNNEDHIQMEQSDLAQCVELEKIDGYWRIVGLSTSGPADVDRVTETVW
ncbi:MAG: hypothetical protein E7490_06390 [Ruminococcaceae bacterium]|nr:hypothetical protein [Oscillospiraceae bacterium]